MFMIFVFVNLMFSDFWWYLREIHDCLPVNVVCLLVILLAISGSKLRHDMVSDYG